MPKSETYSPKWNMGTVPHSGTRYVRDSFIDAGIKTTTARKTRRYLDEDAELLWGHCDVGHENWMQVVKQSWPDVRHFIVVRNPIHTLCTYYHNTADHVEATKQIKKLNVMITDMDLYNRIQANYIKEFNPYIHKVEDPIEQLGEWAGVDLKSDGDRHSRPNGLREAVDSQDADRCFQTIRYSNMWEWFTISHSDNLAPLYRDQLGYDFWWQNG